VRYAEIGWPIFPIWPIVNGRCTCRNPKCDNAGKHPITSGWPRTLPMTADAARLQWAPRLGERGFGLNCGPVAGVFGIDADRRHGAEATLTEWKRQGRRSDTVIDATGDGWHFIYRWPEGFEPEIRAQDLGGGIQCRGAGHYLVLAPSMHRSGRRYEWVRSPFEHEIAVAPDWLLELIAGATKKDMRIANGGPGEQFLVPIGHRHDALVSWLGIQRSMGFGEAALVALADVFLDHAVQIDEARCPLDREQARDDARYIARHYAAHRTNGGSR
jgi:putative DNA primase/helicase